jgi:dTDP-glucose pyrophosphorylase
MQAVVMAAGEGRRLRPLTDRYAKPVLPIDGRPVIVTLLQELQAAGLGPVTVVTGHLGEQVESLLAGLRVRFARQPEALGSADAVLRAGLRPPYIAVAADTVFAPGDVARFVASCVDFDSGLAVRRQPPPTPGHRSAVRIEGGLVTKILDDDASNPLAAAPLWFVGEAVGSQLGGLAGPPYELAEAFQRAIDGGARVGGVEIGKTRDLTFPLDLVVENHPYLRSL